MTCERNPGSFRDPNGFIFQHDGLILRQVGVLYKSNLNLFRESGLERELCDSELLVSAEEFKGLPLSEGVHCFLKPEKIPFISYPYEWSFSQLKDAALLTLEIQHRCLAKGFALKDASAYNVQFLRGRPIFIDHLSFSPYVEGEPWVGYRQFCRHFLAPLALMSLVDVRLGSLLRQYIDGVPLDLASRLLPAISKIRPGLLMHIHAHAKAETHTAGTSTKSVHIGKTAILGLIDSLKTTVRSLSWDPKGTEWANYYDETNYGSEAMASKVGLVGKAIDLLGPKIESCWDLGANTGEFSRIPANRGIDTLAWDIDPAAVEKNYLRVKQDGSKRLLPLLQDLTNPSADLGWNQQERSGFVGRGPSKLILALALVHHLGIGNNVPLPMIASFFREVGENAIVEFVPKEDSQVRRMLSHREDVFAEYSLEHWRSAVEPRFKTLAEWPIPGTERTLFVLEGRERSG